MQQITQLKAEELKIGNILSLPERAKEDGIVDVDYCIVTGITSKVVHWKTPCIYEGMFKRSGTSYGDEDLQPIQLSEECLLTKLEGFKKDDAGNIWRETKDGYISLREMDEYWNCTIVFFWDETDEPEHRYLLPKMNFIHQLQNAWVVITSEELKIKE